MTGVRLSDRRERAAESLLEIGAVHRNVERPFIVTSGWASPASIGCRRPVSTPGAPAGGGRGA
jgi:orotate phosphoribosyltransferase